MAGGYWWSSGDAGAYLAKSARVNTAVSPPLRVPACHHVQHEDSIFSAIIVLFWPAAPEGFMIPTPRPFPISLRDICRSKLGIAAITDHPKLRWRANADIAANNRRRWHALHVSSKSDDPQEPACRWAGLALIYSKNTGNLGKHSPNPAVVHRVVPLSHTYERCCARTEGIAAPQSACGNCLIR